MRLDGYHYCTRAKYIPGLDSEGKPTLRLALVQSFSCPRFNASSFSDSDSSRVRDDSRDDDPDCEVIGAADSIERATRRAKIAAFDKILCNPDLDTFATFTVDPAKGIDVTDYDTLYARLRPWLSNRVSRHGLKYVIVPEHHKSGAIHFHGIVNSSALKLVRAHSPHSGRALSHQGNPLYNIADFPLGFTSAERICDSSADREKVAKYIFKYMGKQSGAKIGGRYMLSGGELVRPVYLYGDAPEQFIEDQVCLYDREVDIGSGVTYREFSFI